MNYFNSIRLNDLELEGEALTTHVVSKINDKNTPDWEKSIFDFIGELINDDEYILAHSSGTTGESKQIQLKKNDLIESALRTQNYFNLSSTDNALLCLPASYIAGKMMIVRAFVCGFNLRYVEPSSNPLQGLNEAIDFVALTPHQLSCSLQSSNLVNLKNIIVGGAPVSERLLQEIQSLKCRVYETYGMTETCSHIAIKPLNGDLKSELFSVLSGFNVSLDERECLVVELRDGIKLVTNDIVQINGNAFKWLGRYDNVINSGGIKLFPEQIEKKLETVLKQKFIVGSEEHDVLGKQVVLIVESGAGKLENINIESITKAFNGVLSSYERPKKLYLLPEFIETSNGKIKRKETIDSIIGIKGHVL